MKVEASIMSVSVRFKKLCKNYALRILKMQNSNLVKQRVSTNFSFKKININEISLTNYNSQLLE